MNINMIQIKNILFLKLLLISMHSEYSLIVLGLKRKRRQLVFKLKLKKLLEHLPNMWIFNI